MRGKVKPLGSSFISTARSGINTAEEVDMVAFLIKRGAEGTRTPDLLRAKEALSQLSYSPICRDIIAINSLIGKMSVIISVALKRGKAKWH